MVVVESLDEKNEKPILFSPPMVQAIWDDRKTKTRRVAKISFLPGFNPDWTGYKPILENGKFFLEGSNHKQATTEVKIPYQVGDILWVRETWCNINKDGIAPEYYYLADCLRPWVEDYSPADWKWKPSIHMPRIAARLFLKVKDIRVERLQNITGWDVLAEGVDNGRSNPTMGERWENMQRLAFQDLWDNLYSKRGYGWDLNPWVWVIEFERMNDPK